MLACKVFPVIVTEWFPVESLKLVVLRLLKVIAFCDWVSYLTVGEVIQALHSFDRINSLSGVDVTSLRSLSRGVFSLPTDPFFYEG